MGLRKLSPSRSLSNHIWFYLVYLEARLRCDPDASDLTPPITTLIGEVETTFQDQRTKWRAVIVAQALVDYLNAKLDRQTGRFSRALLNLGEIDGDTKSPRYTRYFNVALSRIVRLALGPQIKVQRPWIQSILTEAGAAVQAFGAIFTDIIDQGELALKAQENAASRRNDFRARDITDLVKRINKACQETHGTLRARAPSLEQPPEWADGFFYSPRNASPPIDPAGLYQDALYGVFEARGLELSDEVDEKIQETKDTQVLNGWLLKAVSSVTPEEALGLPAPKPD